MSAPPPPMSGLIVRSEQPFNAEPPLPHLRAAFVTPQATFYVRSHGEVPRLDEAHHRLRVGGRVAQPLDLSMAELRQRFPHRTVPAVLQCAGNRRSDLHRVRPVSGDLWAPGAIGHAEWTGVPLAEVLRAAGAAPDEALHVAFSASDMVDMPGEESFRFGISIPMGKAMSGEVLLAFAINGEALTPEHGFPLRVVVPGFAGIRSAKWVTGITVQDEPADTPMQRKNYKLLPPDIAAPPFDWERGFTINEMPLTSAICEPEEQATLPAGPTLLRGYATASGRGVTRVDVSADGGRRWQQAELERRPGAPWSWTFWQTRLELSPGEHELVVRAWDSAGQTQPASPEEVWNAKGYLCASWHRVRVRAD
ncbi:molybdopterin oxidoreductase [Roseomonas sp. M0104]|uniref:Molybdopterin oxidoreductase n=1 Tax=Teichococcus coralli TaxID=2545983 RepID=A0A845B547_9PROT|nr:sulfite oxidase [Pseudoroseomonas coralli]MXP62321.1 molybdopterin oxidoreductase [Pseudoroseomonas coralli]